MARALPDFPWDSLASARAKAAQHPDGIVDLSVGTPVDPTPDVVREALADASDAHGYPQVWGTGELRRTIAEFLIRTWGSLALPDEGILPVIGTKELVAWLPTLLDVGASDTVVVPTTAYPTYEVGAAMVGARVVRCDDPAELDPADIKLIWINSPANPHGRILSVDELRSWVQFARRSGAILASDECYLDFAWDAQPVSVLHPDVCDGSPDRLLAVHSTSKRSNMAGFRAGFVAGDPGVVQPLVGLRKHLGMMVPAPVQAAMRASLLDAEHVAAQRERYLARRNVLRPALEAAGFTIDGSEGSLYLWATRGEDCRASVEWLADRGILVAPGDFYGTSEHARRHVRVALTATDERIQAAAARLS